MGILADLDKKLTDNLYEQGRAYRTRCRPAEGGRRNVDRLMPFIQPEAREVVRRQVLGLVHEYRIENPAGAAEQD
ncbi:hypothetical protein [Mesorhizobium sp. WSM4312]|uniref:hypothetical protein n=1 Tax=Mesorhizobium sp. WSM4312 TaxID=2029411 RepID=UPI001FE0855E|nr:hypothetical protein [Mesorhizobium sp. WSM4312]